MANSDHLDWLEIRDFTPGLHNRNKSMPYNAAQSMVDCYPLPEGGLRPFFDDGAITTTGLDMSTGDQIIGIGAHIGLPHRTATGTAIDRYLVKYDQSDSTIRLYRMDETNSDTTWTQLTDVTFATNTSGSWSQAFLQSFVETNGTRWMLLGLNYGGSGSSGPGIYRIRYEEPDIGNDGEVQLIQVARPTGLIVNQGRWMYAQEETSTLYYSEVGDAQSEATNYLDITPSGPGSFITALASQEPSDILVGKQGGAWVSISGDISSASTVVRELSAAHPAGRRPVAPQPAPGGGVVFIADQGSVYITDGRNFQDVAENVRWPMFTRLQGESFGNSVVGQPAFMADYLFIGGNLVKDMRTGAIFQIFPAANDNLDLWVPDHTRQRIWGASLAEAGDATMYEYQTVGDGVYRSPACAWVSAPFMSKTGSDVRIREVEVYWQTGTAAQNDITVTRYDADGTGSVARSITDQPASTRQRLQFSFPNTGSQYQYIRLDWNTSGSQTEAATIDRIRIGMAPGRGLG